VTRTQADAFDAVTTYRGATDRERGAQSLFGNDPTSLRRASSERIGKESGSPTKDVGELLKRLPNVLSNVLGRRRLVVDMGVPVALDLDPHRLGLQELLGSQNVQGTCIRLIPCVVEADPLGRNEHRGRDREALEDGGGVLDHASVSVIERDGHSRSTHLIGACHRPLERDHLPPAGDEPHVRLEDPTGHEKLGGIVSRAAFADGVIGQDGDAPPHPAVVSR